jgi:hypothetical protein
MKPAAGYLKLSQFNFYILAVVVAAAALIVQLYMEKTSYRAQSGIISATSLAKQDSQDSKDSIPPWEEKALQTYSDMSGLLTTLSTALLGGLGYLLINSRAAGPQGRHRLSALASAVFAVLSLYYGYVSHLSVLASTYRKTFNPYELGLRWPSRAQFYALLLAVFFFADFAFHELGKEVPDERA